MNEGRKEHSKHGQRIRVDAMGITVQVRSHFLVVLELGQIFIRHFWRYNALEEFRDAKYHVRRVLKAMEGILGVGSRDLM